MKRTLLPTPWYYSIAELAQEWSVHPDRVHYYFDTGQMVPAALIPTAALYQQAWVVTSPHVCVPLDRFHDLTWTREFGELVAYVSGELPGFLVAQGQPRNVVVALDPPVRLVRSELVVLLEQKEYLEESAKPRHQSLNPIERRTLLMMFGVMLQSTHAGELNKPYAVATRVCAALDALGIYLSKETVASKIRDAVAELAAASAASLNRAA